MSRPLVIIFQNLAKQNKFQANTMFTTGETLGLAEWIIDDTCLVIVILDRSLFYTSKRAKWKFPNLKAC